MTNLRQWLLKMPSDSMKDSRTFIVRFSIASRLVICLGMVASAAVVGDFFDPGKDVLRFDLRLNDGPPCFCLHGDACDKRAHHDRHWDPLFRECATDTTHMESSKFLTKIYNVMLTPFTRWDAARFLRLAVHPDARKPIPVLVDVESHCGDDKTCENDDLFVLSEQAHAFFPLFPLMIRYTALFLVWIIPGVALPPSFEGVSVLAAILVNFILFVMTSLVLHDLTYRVAARNTSNDPSTSLTPTEMQRCLHHAQVCAVLFCINPASVFFSTAYSESSFAFLTFLGYNVAFRGNVVAATLLWTIASFVRSNGTMASLWLVIWNVATFLKSIQSGTSLTWSLVRAAYYLMLAVIVALPVIFHDWRGYSFHCLSDSTMQPSWCATAQEETNLLPFSLYGYVQRKHWNVGFLRYYELKQIPNFLLATPVLWLGFSGSLTWIHASWKSFVARETSPSNSERAYEAVSWKRPIHIIQWAISALQDSVAPSSTASASEEGALLMGPHVLTRFAVLSAFSLVGATVAHVQVSTRLIFSSCPAIYWYMTTLLIQRTDKDSESKVERGHLVLYYCLIYIVLGIVMHVNWLPWT